MSSMGAESLLAVVLFLSGAIVTGHPVGHQDATGLDAALSNIANSVVVVHDETVEPANEPDSSELHLHSANAIPSLQHIALMDEVPHILAGVETTVFANGTDSKSVIELTVLPVGSNSSSSIADEETPKDEEDEKDEEHTTELFMTTTTAEESVETTTELDTEAFTTVEAVTRGAQNVTSVTVITVLHSEQGGQEKEEEIKETIKEVEAMPVILTVGV
ncbi:hypothetical protein AND_010149 [Anopheles darlingi]|uniref:Uncharacterized protein n=1 Tax=Anopheles darlingi TaxID=43151 RepID=W5J360_ANODA|nr:hypothetical protein AND_010149 [Anopheles darlingi]